MFILETISDRTENPIFVHSGKINSFEKKTRTIYKCEIQNRYHFNRAALVRFNPWPKNVEMAFKNYHFICVLKIISQLPTLRKVMASEQK